MDIQIFKLATKLIITGLLFRQAASEDEYKRAVKPCNYDSDCIANAYCKEQQYCQCKKDFIIYDNETGFSCLEEASRLGDACEADIQCTKPFGNYAECVTREGLLGTCNCKAGAHFKDGSCYETSLIGEKCKVSNNCYLASGQPAYCDRSLCACPNKYHPNPDGTDCIKTVHLDEPCHSDQECVTENSRCAEVCRCKVNYIQSRQKDKCLKAADNVGEPCEENEQCTAFLMTATCGADGLCTCSPGYHHITPNSRCFRDVGLGDTCEESAECLVSSAACSLGRCQCEQGFSPSEDNSKCIGENGQEPSQYSLRVLVITFVLPKMSEYFKCSL